MRIEELKIKRFKNLNNLSIGFDLASPYTVLVGANGSGKSNLLEALSLIFRNLDLELEAPFSYELTYSCRGHTIRVEAEEDGNPQFWIRSQDNHDYADLPRRRFMQEDIDGRPMYRPAFVFGYYSGPSNRLETIYEKHRERYYNWIIKARAQRDKTGVTDPNALRRLFYAQALHGQFALLAFFMEPSTGEEDDRAFLRRYLQIDDLDSVLFSLKKPPWRRKGGDERFWNAEGEVREFLDKLYQAALLPARMERRISVDVSRSRSVENLYLFLPGPEALKKVYESYKDQYAFFTALESTHLSELLSEVRTRVRMAPTGGGGSITYRDLSEGEQQLLLVLGLLKFTAREEALFLLDEPDTHLNPVWSTRYLGFLERFIQDRESCHIVMSSHDPLVFAGLERAQVRIFRRGQQGEVIVDVPDQAPRGMGIAAILTSDLFGLHSTLDQATQKVVDRQRWLSTRATLSSEEEEELRTVTDRLNRLGFWRSTRDPLYDLFVEKWMKRVEEDTPPAFQLSPEQILERDQLAEEIVAELAAEKDHGK